MGIYSGPEIVKNGLVLHLDAASTKSYPGSGTTWTDLSGNGNNGTLINGPTFDSDNAGNVFFNANNKYVSIPNLATTSIWDNNFSGIFWVRWKGGVDSGIFGFLSSPTNFHFEIRSGGLLRLRDRNMNDIQVPSAISQNVWACLSFTREINTYKVFKNGIQIGIRTQAPGDVTFLDLPTLGQSFTIGARPFDGNISNFKMYNKALTAQEIRQNFYATRGRYNV
jgi:hypothetical protein